MNEKIENMVNQLSENEKQELAQYIERAYAVDFTGDKMLRDDIKDKLIELIQVEFSGTQFIEEKSELEVFEIDSLDRITLASEIENEFDIDFISPDHTSGWNTVKDIVSHIETALEEKEFHISGFEPEV